MLKDQRLCCLIQPPGKNDYWMKRLLDGIEAESKQRKYQNEIVYFSVRDETEPPPFSGVPVLLAGTASGWFFASVKYALTHGCTPIIVNACMPEQTTDVSGVCFALENAVEDCLKYLGQLGGKRPALIGLNPSSDADRLKAAVFRAYTQKNETESDCVFCEQAGLGDSIEACIEEMLAHGADALLCANDTTAILAEGCLKKRGITPDASFPVIGMGNSYLGMNTDPPLTSVGFDYYELGAEAVRLYDYLSSSTSGVSVQIRIPTALHVRASTGDVPFTSRVQASAVVSKTAPDYFGGDPVHRLIMLENDLQHSDAIDREIIFGVARGETYPQLAARLYLSERTLKYRLSRILSRLGLHSKAQLNALVQEVLQTHDTL